MSNLWFRALICLLLLVGIDASSSGGEPTEQLRTTADEVLRIVTAPEFKSGKNPQERRRQLRKAIEPRFDFFEMSRRALGRHWKDLSQEERPEFVTLFADLLEHAYAGSIDSYKYEGEKVRYLRERVDLPYAEVETKIIKGGNEFAVNYRMIRNQEQWKVYDVTIEGVSIVNNFRSQFNKILAKSSKAELMNRLREKQKELRSQ